MSLMMDSSENPKRQANKFLVPAIASSSSELLPGTRRFASINKTHGRNNTLYPTGTEGCPGGSATGALQSELHGTQREPVLRTRPTEWDLTKDFDTVNPEELRKIMQKFGCLERFSQLVRQLHDDMTARATDGGVVSEAFAMTNGVKQGYVLAPTFFSLMLVDAYLEELSEIRVAHRTDSHHLISGGCTSSRAALHDTWEGDMQRSMDPFDAAGDNFGLVINAEETVVIHQPSPDAAYVSPQIHVNGGQMKVVDNFTYLGSILSRNTKIDDEVVTPFVQTYVMSWVIGTDKPVTPFIIERLLDENDIILSVISNKMAQSKFEEAAKFQAILQRNLMFLLQLPTVSVENETGS
ncbi:hypothetical protein SprV_0200623600 [Sparganum proliferum]